MIAAGLHQVSSGTVWALIRVLYGYNTARWESALPYSYPRFKSTLPSATRLFVTLATRIGAIPKYQVE